MMNCGSLGPRPCQARPVSIIIHLHSQPVNRPQSVRGRPSWPHSLSFSIKLIHFEGPNLLLLVSVSGQVTSVLAPAVKMARRQSKTTQSILEYQEEFRLLMAKHYMTLPGKKPLIPSKCRGLSLCLDVSTDDGDQLNVIEARHPNVHSANLSLSFRNEPRLNVECFKFDWVFDESDDAGVKFTNIGEGLITTAGAGGTGLIFFLGEMKRKNSFLQLSSEIARGLLQLKETVTFSLLNVDGNEVVDLLAGGNKIQFLKDKTGQLGVRNLLENRLTSTVVLEKVLEKFSNVFSADEMIKFR